MGDSTGAPRITEREKACIRQFAEMFEQGDDFVSTSAEAFLLDGQKLQQNEFESLMRMMMGYGVIDEVKGNFEGGWTFSITHLAVQKAREIEEQEKQEKEPGDIVEKVSQSVRKQWFLALAIIGFFVLTAAVTLANQLVQLLQNLGWMAKP